MTFNKETALLLLLATIPGRSSKPDRESSEGLEPMDKLKN
jgi:hypothetical protein